MVSEKICGTCKNLFLPKLNRDDIKFCSRSCYNKYYVTTQKFKKTRDKRNKYSRQYYTKNPLEYRNTRKIYAKSEKAKDLYREYYYKNKEKILIRKKTRDKGIKKSLCEKCFSKLLLEIHHLSYEPNIYVTLCKKCHLTIHNKRCLI